MSDLKDFLNLIAEGKQDYKQNDFIGKKLEEVKEHVKIDLGQLFAELSVITAKDQQKSVQEVHDEHVLLSTLTETIEPASVGKEEELPTIQEEPDPIQAYKTYFKDASFQQPDVPTVDPTIKAVQDKLKFIEQWLGKISAHGPGSGEVNLRWLDDVARETISDGRWLKYDASRKKFVFDEINPFEVVNNVTEITTPNYTVIDGDYYLGVNYAGDVTITLPSDPNSGRMLIIKDEYGNAETNPITVHGTVDNDTGGFIIQINNGAIQLIYRNGWRIV
jgi:hypothetical protein